MARVYAYAATVQQKVDWLLLHQELWRGYSGEYAVKKVVVSAMKRDRLFSRDTFAGQVDLQGLVNRARKQRRERGYECDDAA